MKRKISLSEIENIACDGRIILALSKPIFLNKRSVYALAEIPPTTDIRTAYEAIKAAAQRVKYAYNIDLILSPHPAEISAAAINYKEVCEVIINAINSDFRIEKFTAAETEKGVFFNFDLAIPAEYKMNNAELLKELKSQFRKLGNNINISVTIIREHR